MAIRSKYYELFGSYLLFKKLESDSFSELWRSAQIQGTELGPLLALRRFTGGDREALTRAVMAARNLLPLVTGTTVVKSQFLDVVDSVPLVAHEYASGRSLRHVIDRARAGAPSPHPVPLDQALAIGEKLAASLETIGNLKHQGTRLNHGALIPQFVWITDDGEVRVAAQQIGKGLIASLKTPAVGKEIGGYFAPEVRQSGEPSRSSDVFSIGAVLYLLLTGKEPPDPTSSQFEQTIARATLMAGGAPIPGDIRPILARSLALDPDKRYPSASEMRQDLGRLLTSGAYAPTTFNLAFYLSTLLKKEMEADAADREKEAAVNISAYQQRGSASSDLADAAQPAISLGLPKSEPKSRLPLIAAVVAVAALALGALVFYLLSGSKETARGKIASQQSPPPPATQQPLPLSEPIVASAEGSGTMAPATTTDLDAASKRKLLEQEINRRLQEEMMKLQSDFERKSAPAATRVAVAGSEEPETRATLERNAPSAAELDQSRRSQQTTTTPAIVTNTSAPPSISTATVAPVTVTTAPVVKSPAVTTPAQTTARQVAQGDLIAINDVDRAPELLSPIKPVYPPMAAKQHLEGTVILSALISENGKVLDVKVLRGDTRKIGFDEAALRAVRAASFSPAVKDGKKVKTWKPIPIIFKLRG